MKQYKAWPKIGREIFYSHLHGPVKELHKDEGFFTIHDHRGDYYNISIDDYTKERSERTKKMPRETKAARLLREEQERAAAKVAEEAYKANLPKRIIEAQIIASYLPITTSLSSTDNGPSVRFYNDYGNGNPYIDMTITYDTPEWEMVLLEERLAETKKEIDAKQARRLRAQELIDSLSSEDRLALMENFHLVK